MKKFLMLFAMLFAMVLPAAAAEMDNDNIRQALYGALDMAAKDLRTAKFGKNTVAVFPLDKYHSAVSSKLQAVLTGAGFVCVNAKDDPMWNEIIKEIAWDEKKNDILDPATIDLFGKLKSAQILLRCQVRSLNQNPDRVYAEIDLQAVEIATNTIVWAGNYAYRYYVGKDVHGIVSLDNDLRMLLKKNFALAGSSMKDPAFAAKLDNIKSVTVVPLAGDIDRYMTGLAIEMISSGKMVPQNPRIPSLTLIRSFARDGQLGSDAVFYGAIRDLSSSTAVSGPKGDKMVTSRTVSADIQMFLEDAKGNILWSKTVTLSEVVSSEREMTAQEKLARTADEMKIRQLELEMKNRIRQMELDAAAKLRKMELESAAELRKIEQENEKEIREKKIDDAPELIKEDLVDNWKTYVKNIAIILGGIILLILIIIGVKAFFSYNNVR